MDNFGQDPFSAAAQADDVTGEGRARDSLFLTARLRFAGDAQVSDVRVRNLSAGGLMAESDRIVPPGTAATLELRGIGEAAGKVAWCTEGRIGIAFDRAIDPKKARKPVGAGVTTPDYAKPFARR